MNDIKIINAPLKSVELIFFDDFSEGLSIQFLYSGQLVTGIFKHNNSAKILNHIKNKKNISLSGYYKNEYFVCKGIN